MPPHCETANCAKLFSGPPTQTQDFAVPGSRCLSRDFAKVLDYADYRNFQSVIESARTACFNSGQRVEDHFVEVTDMIEVGKDARRPAKTVMMSRYACYLEIANKAHRDVGAKVRQAIKELGGTMPEELPTVESVKKLEAKARKALKKPKP